MENLLVAIAKNLLVKDIFVNHRNIRARMRTLLFSVSCGGATAGNKDGRSSLAKTVLLTMELSDVFVVIVLLFDLGRLSIGIISA